MLPMNLTVTTPRPLAAITGASDGIGEEFARQLAAQGYDLLLIARRENLLNEIKADLETRFGIVAEVYPCDLADPEQTRKLEAKLESSDRLEFMVNNAGFGNKNSSYPDVEADLEERMIQVHVISLMRLARAAVQPMCRQKKGFLINLSSVAAFLYGPGCVEYNATKAYVLSFSKSLQCDVRQHGVRVQALCPGLTHTSFHTTESMKGFRKDKTPGVAWLPVEYVVRSSLRSIRKSRRSVCIPSWRYKIALCLLCNPLGNLICEMIYSRRVKNGRMIG